MSKETAKLSLMNEEQRTIYLAKKMDENRTINLNGMFLKGEKGDKGDKGDLPTKGVDYFTDEEAQDFLEKATPIKGVHYFTDEDLASIKDEVTPQKGVHYFDGKDGIRGLKGEKGEKGERGEKGDKGDDGEFDIKEVIKELKKKPYLEPKDIKGMPLNMSDMRWHGGGLSTVSTDSTLIGNGTPSSPLSVVSGAGFQRVILTGTVSMTNPNNVFTSLILPIVIVSDGVQYEQTDYNGGLQWSYTGSVGAYTITTVFYPQSSIYGYFY